jgi:hypothetical protein
MHRSAALTLAIMDRNPHVRELICRELAGRGHVAVPVRTGAEAVGLLKQPLPPQVLVVDPETAEDRLPELARLGKALAGRVTLVLHVFTDAPPVELPGALVVEKEPHLRPLWGLVDTLSRGLVPGGAGASGGGAAQNGLGA